MHRVIPAHRLLQITLWLVTMSAAGFGAESVSEPRLKPASEIPVETFFRAPYFTNARLSPDGTTLAGIYYQSDGIANLALLSHGAGKATVLQGNKRMNISSVRWLDKDQILFSAIFDKIYAGGVHLVDRNKLGESHVIAGGRSIILGCPDARPRSVLIWRPRRVDDLNNDFDVAEVLVDEMIRQSRAVKTFAPDYRTRINYPEPSKEYGAILTYRSDVVGELALCYVYLEGRIRAMVYDPLSRGWSLLSFDANSTRVLEVEPDHEHMWVSEYSPGAGFQVSRYAVATQVREPAIHTDPLFDPAEGFVHYSLKSNSLAGISYPQRRLRNLWIDPKFDDLQKAIDHLLPDTDNRIVDWDDGEKTFLIRSVSDQEPGAYYLLDSEKGILTPMARSYPWLAGYEFAQTRAVMFKARDGLQLEGYLTIPKSASPANRVPLVVLCHGGPTVRDEWLFDREAQFLASRGYAVLQPNYRGSSGYKPAISSDNEYDYLRMHEDVTDATNAFRNLEVIDGDRVAIMGASFGGYLAASGAAFDGNLYRCAITSSGVFDWEGLARQARSEGRPGEYEMLRDHLGKPGRDSGEFAKISPLFATENIKIPVFIAHGREDTVVEFEQSKKLASRLKHQGTPVETFFPENELHGFRSPENRTKYYSQVEAFLARYLKGQHAGES